MILAILGRQPAISLAELEMFFGSEKIKKISKYGALVDTDLFDIEKLGGIQKAGSVIGEIDSQKWDVISRNIISLIEKEYSGYEGKITLGMSVYGINVSAREVQKTGITLKQNLKKQSTSLRLIPNMAPILNTAVSHHNKLGLSNNKVELLVVASQNGTYIAKSTGGQNITAYARRDQGRPKRDAFVGMLPPKLAQIMVNLATKGIDKQTISNPPTVLDPFCGTGVVLQEAMIKGFNALGSDLSDKMIDYSRENLEWLSGIKHLDRPTFNLKQGDAMTTVWKKPIDFVVCESYLGQPFSAPPSSAKLEEVVGNCNHIISNFLKNLSTQIEPGTPVCIAVPAWRDKHGYFSHLPIIDNLGRIGYRPHEFRHVSKNDLIYYREDQVVAREILLLEKI